MATNQQLKNREIAASGGTPVEPTTPTEIQGAGFDMAKLGQAIQDKFLNDGGVVSSQSTNLEAKTQESISRIEKGTEAFRARTEFQAEEAIDREEKLGAQRLRTAQQSQRGFATNRALLRDIEERTEKNVKDLERRREDLLRSGDIDSADRINALIDRQTDFKLRSEQQTFTNMLQLAGLDLKQQTEDRISKQFKSNFDFQKRQQDFKEEASIAEIALEFGLTVEEGETLQSITAKAKPFATKERNARLSKLVGENNTISEALSLDLSIGNLLNDGQNPEEVALNLIGILKDRGIKVNDKKFEQIRQRATELFNDRNTKLEFEQAKEQGKSNIKMKQDFFLNQETGEVEIRLIPDFEKSPLFTTTPEQIKRRIKITKERAEEIQKQKEEKNKLKFSVTPQEDAFFNNIFGS